MQVTRTVKVELTMQELRAAVAKWAAAHSGQVDSDFELVVDGVALAAEINPAGTEAASEWRAVPVCWNSQRCPAAISEFSDGNAINVEYRNGSRGVTEYRSLNWE